MKNPFGEILPLCRPAMEEAERRWASIAKPLGSLGSLERLVVRLAGISGSSRLDFSKRCNLVFCADNGVVEEGVSQTDSSVTRVVSANLAGGRASANLLGQLCGCDVFPVDIGLNTPLEIPGILDRNIRRGTGNIAREPAMTWQELLEAVETGVSLVEEKKRQGYQIICTGEMGIGNTTTSSAVTAVLLDLEPARVTGRGAGLSSEGLSRKVEAVRRAIEINRPDASNPLEVVQKVGGLDIAALTGVFLGGAIHRVPVVADGFISGTAALAACRFCPPVKDFLIGSHISGEPGGRLVLQALGTDTFLDCGLRLGEGTGAILLLPLLDATLKIYREMDTFEDIAIRRYQPFEEEEKG